MSSEGEWYAYHCPEWLWEILTGLCCPLGCALALSMRVYLVWGSCVRMYAKSWHYR